MKHCIALPLLALLIAGCSPKTQEPAPPTATAAPAAAAMPDPASGLLVVGENEPCTADLQAVHFFNLQTGLVAGVGQTLLRTVDGGRTWTRLLAADPEAGDFAAVYGSTNGTAWCHSRKRLLFSSDFGATWAGAQEPASTFYYFGACSPVAERLFMIQPPTYGATVFTTAKGQTWERLSGILPRNDFAALYALDTNRLWLAGDQGRVARTRNGGASWEMLPWTNGASLCQLQFFSDRVGRGRSVYEGVYATSDGGASWVRLEAAGAHAAADMQWLTPEDGFLLVAADHGSTRLLRTQDAGTSWTEVARFPAAAADLSALPSGEAWVVGAKGYFARAATTRDLAGAALRRADQETQ